MPEAWNQRLIMWKLRLFSKVYARQTILGAIFIMPSRLIGLYLKGGEEAVQLARFLRLAQVWGILMIGSAITLAAAAIQLALAYSSLESPVQLDRAHQRLRSGTR